MNLLKEIARYFNATSERVKKEHFSKALFYALWSIVSKTVFLLFFWKQFYFAETENQFILRHCI